MRFSTLLPLGCLTASLLGCGTHPKQTFAPPGDYVPIDKVQIPGKFQTIELTRENYAEEVLECIPLFRQSPERIFRNLDRFPASSVTRRFAQCYVGDVVMSAITYAELEYGVAASVNSKSERRNLAGLVEDIPVVPFDGGAGAAYGPIRMATRDSKKDHLDKLIAAHAASLNVTLVTNNVKDFARYPGVVIENWLDPTEAVDH